MQLVLLPDLVREGTAVVVVVKEEEEDLVASLLERLLEERLSNEEPGDRPRPLVTP